MSAARIVVYDPKVHKNDRTDRARVDALTDADIARAVADDPDAAPLLTETQLRRALWVIPVGKEAISIRLQKQTVMMARYSQELERVMGSSRPVTSSDRVVAGATTCVATVKVIQPTGVLDVTNCSQLRREIMEVANTDRCHVLVDCQNLGFMDSSGLSALVLASQKMREVNGQLSICSINQQIEMLFELSSMDDIFEIFPSSEDFYRNHNPDSQ